MTLYRTSRIYLSCFRKGFSKSLAIIFALSTLVSFAKIQQAHALFEARASVGALSSQLNLADVYAISGAPSTTPAYGFGADVIIMPPLFPIGFGARYETTGLKSSGGGADFNFSTSRTSVLINSRFIDSFIYLGPIFTYGISHTATLNAKVSDVEVANWTGSSLSSYTIGVEGGVNLIGIVIGGELGYEDFRWKGATDTISSQSKDINLSGNYLRIMFGFGI